MRLSRLCDVYLYREIRQFLLNLPVRNLMHLVLNVIKVVLCNQIGCIFWIQGNGLQAVKDFAISLEIIGAIKVGGPYQALDEHYTRGWIW